MKMEFVAVAVWATRTRPTGTRLQRDHGQLRPPFE